jgi:hypothetical protein
MGNSCMPLSLQQEVYFYYCYSADLNEKQNHEVDAGRSSRKSSHIVLQETCTQEVNFYLNDVLFINCLIYCFF